MQRFSNNRPKCSAVKNPVVTLYLPVRWQYLACMEHRLPRAWMFCVTDGSKRMYRKATQLCNCSLHPPRQPRLTTALVCICKYSSGWRKGDDVDQMWMGLATSAESP